EHARRHQMDAFRAALKAQPANKHAATRMEFPGLHRSGAEVDLEAALGTSHEGGRAYYTAVIRDITARKRTERRLALGYAVSRVLAASDTIDAATPNLLKAICESSGADFGELWLTATDKRSLRSVGTWSATKRENRGLAEATLPEVNPRAGVAGRVWG